MKHYTCSECDHKFTSDEVSEGSYLKDHEMCARCYVEGLDDAGAIELPRCFAIGYDSTSSLCTSVCTVQKGCLIGYIDRAFADGGLQVRTLSYNGNNKRRATLAFVAERILRAVGRPVHLADLGPALERETNGDFLYDPIDGFNANATSNKQMFSNIQDQLSRSKNILYLGDGFFVWRGCWEPETGKAKVDMHHFPMKEKIDERRNKK